MTSDDYGFDALRAHMARQLGLQISYVEKIYSDEAIHAIRRDNEPRLLPVTAGAIFGDEPTCECGAPSHLTETERDLTAQALNEAYGIVPGGAGLYAEDFYSIRYGVTQAHREAADAAASDMGAINRDRCIAARVRARATA